HPNVPLAAVYPSEGTLISDNPFVSLTATSITADQTAASADLRSYLRARAQQALLQQQGFRDEGGRAASTAGQQVGTLPAEPKRVIKLPSAEVLDKLQAAWWQIRKPARVLVIVDVSGSMDSGAIPGQPASKLELA